MTCFKLQPSLETSEKKNHMVFEGAGSKFHRKRDLFIRQIELIDDGGAPDSDSGRPQLYSGHAVREQTLEESRSDHPIGLRVEVGEFACGHLLKDPSFSRSQRTLIKRRALDGKTDDQEQQEKFEETAPSWLTKHTSCEHDDFSLKEFAGQKNAGCWSKY